MLPGRAGRNAARRFSSIPSTMAKLGVRHKSEPSRHVDDFPYKYLNRSDSSHMSAEMESTTRLALRSFFAQHRPLMPFAKPLVHEDKANFDNTKWVHVPVHNGRPPLFMTSDRPQWNVVPENVARSLGPFDREHILRTRRFDNNSTESAPVSPRNNSSRSMEPRPMSPVDVQSMLKNQFPILMEHLSKVASSDGEVHFIPLSLDKPVDDEFDEYSDEIEATSVQRKRKLKMSRHKYRKRLKEQRTKRRRLGK